MSGEPRPRSWATSSTGSQAGKPISPEGSAPLVGGERAPELVWPSRDEELGALEAFASEANTPRALVVETSSADSSSPSDLDPSTLHGGEAIDSGRPERFVPPSEAADERRESERPGEPGRAAATPAPLDAADVRSEAALAPPATVVPSAPPAGAEGPGGKRSPGSQILPPSIRGPGRPPPSSLRDRHAEPNGQGADGRPPRRLRLLLLALILAVLAQGAYIAVRFFGPDGGTVEADGEIVIESRPSGANVLIDGRPRGKTPLRVRVWPGYHVVELRAGGAVRRQHVGVAAGQIASQYVELGAAAAPSPETPKAAAKGGSLVITSDPSGAQVEIGGQARGSTPLTLKELPAGRHSVRVNRGGVEQTRDVEITAGETTTLAVMLAPKPPPRPTTGQVTIASTIPVTVTEDGDVLGSSEGGRLELEPGRHVLTLVNETYGFRNEQMIDVTAGGRLTVAVTLPEGQLRANATPWAEVFANGRSLGETPIGQATLPLGRYELVFRHPKLGERRVPVTIRADEPAVATVDFTR